VSNFVYRKTNEELNEALTRKIGQLRRAALSYDAGKFDEAERIASDVYILLHDGGRNARSLLGQVGKKSTISFPDSRHSDFIEKPEKFIGIPLFSCGKSFNYIPILGTSSSLDAMNKYRFSKWWDQTVYITHRGLKLSRKNLVCSLRSQDGGAHVDDNLKSESYHWLKTQGDKRIVSSQHGFQIFNDHSVDSLAQSSVPWVRSDMTV
jgi:hypothetical protein